MSRPFDPENFLRSSQIETTNGLSNQELSELINIAKSTVEKWKTKLLKGEAIKPRKYPDFADEWQLNSQNLWIKKTSPDRSVSRSDIE